MNRRHPRKLLSLYLDQAVSPAQKQRVEKHLQQCAGCAREAASLQRLRQEMSELPRPPVPRGLAARIMAQYRSQQRASFWGSFDIAPRLLQPAMVLLLLLTMLAFVWKGRGENIYDQAIKSYTAVYENSSSWSSLNNDEEALRFALNHPPQSHQERDNDQ